MRSCPSSSTCDEPVSSVDFYPTFVEIAGALPPRGQTLDGQSLLGLLTGRGRPDRDALYWHYPHYHHSTPAGAVRSGDWKLIEFFEDGHLELYNLKDDIGESIDLSESRPEITARLHGMLKAWRQEVNAKLPAANPDYDPLRAGEWGRHPGR